MTEESGRFRAVKTSPPRYEDGVIGLPPSAMVITNSDRRTAWCQRRWFYSDGLGLASGGSGAMYFGSCVHAAMESVFRYWMVTDKSLPDWWMQTPVGFAEQCLHCHDKKEDECLVCEGSGLGPYATAMKLMKTSFEPDEWETEEARLHDVIFGYFRKYGEGPLNDYKVVAVELAVATPILSPVSGRVYRSLVPIVQQGDGSKMWRAARVGEKDISQNVSFPWYQCGRMDAVLQHRRTGDLWVHEFKTSANPVAYGRDLHLDTQICGYMRALQHASELGHFGADKPSVAGYQWDVLGSRKHTKPRVLKSGKVSMAKNQRIASWHWKDFLQTIKPNTYLPSDLEELNAQTIIFKETVDVSLYHREWGTFAQELQDRYAVELFADAKRFANMRRKAVSISPFDETQIGEHFPRTPICRIQGHGCAYKGPCLLDSKEARDSFDTKESIVWMSRDYLNKQTQEQESNICPF